MHSSPTLANIKVSLGLWGKIKLLIKTYWFIIFNIDEWFKEKEVDKVPAGDIWKFITDDEYNRKTQEISTQIYSTYFTKNYPDYVIKQGQELGSWLANSKLEQEQKRNITKAHREFKVIQDGKLIAGNVNNMLGSVYIEDETIDEYINRQPNEFQRRAMREQLDKIEELKRGRD